MLYIVAGDKAVYTPGVDFEVERNDDKAAVKTYDRDGRLLKTIDFDSNDIEVKVL